MLELVSLHLDGFGSYDIADFSLNEPGITSVMGPIGSGKSTVPRAIYYLLFGKLLQKKTEFMSIDDLINKILKNGYDISLKLNIDGTPCMIREIRKRKDHGLYFEMDGRSKRGKTDPETRKIIDNHLGVSSDDFRNIAMLGRRQSLKLVTGTSAERIDVLMNVFNISEFDEYISVCKDSIKVTLSDKNVISIKLGELNASLKTFQEQLESFDEFYIDDDVDNVNKKLSSNKSKVSKIDDKIISIRGKIAGIESICDKKSKVELIKSEIANLESKITDADILDISDMEKRLNDLRNSKAVSEAAISQCSASLKKLDSLENICPVNNETCPVDVPIKYKDVNKKELTKKIGGLKRELAVVLSAKKKLDLDMSNAKHAAEVDRTIKSKKEILSNIDYDESDITDTDDLEVQLSEYAKNRSIGVERINDLNKTLAKIELSERNKTLLEGIKKSIDDANKKILSFDKELDKLNDDARYLEASVQVFKAIKMRRINLILGLLNEYANDVLKIISNGKRMVEIVSKRKTSKKSTLDKLGIIMHDGNKSVPVELASDGQETQIGLAMLFGTLKTVYKLSNKSVSCVWLDEVFGPLDAKSFERVFESMIPMFNMTKSQSLYIISHRDIDERFFDRQWKFELIDDITHFETIGV